MSSAISLRRADYRLSLEAGANSLRRSSSADGSALERFAERLEAHDPPTSVAHTTRKDVQGFNDRAAIASLHRREADGPPDPWFRHP
jgi:hypothetical protein